MVAELVKDKKKQHKEIRTVLGTKENRDQDEDYVKMDPAACRELDFRGAAQAYDQLRKAA